MQFAQTELKVIGTMQKSLCHIMVCTEACTVVTWKIYVEKETHG